MSHLFPASDSRTTALLELNPVLGFLRDPHWRQPQLNGIGLGGGHFRQCT